MIAQILENQKIIPTKSVEMAISDPLHSQNMISRKIWLEENFKCRKFGKTDYWAIQKYKVGNTAVPITFSN